MALKDYIILSGNTPVVTVEIPAPLDDRAENELINTGGMVGKDIYMLDVHRAHEELDLRSSLMNLAERLMESSYFYAILVVNESAFRED